MKRTKNSDLSTPLEALVKKLGPRIELLIYENDRRRHAEPTVIVGPHSANERKHLAEKIIRVIFDV